MEFIPAGEVIGEAHQVRTVEISPNSQLPGGEYSFVDSYCTDPACDCRKAMILVMHEGKHVSTINFGWENPTYYKDWMGRSEEDEWMPDMHGASIDITSPDIVKPPGMLGLFNALLDETWTAKFKQHYADVKAALPNKAE